MTVGPTEVEAAAGAAVAALSAVLSPSGVAGSRAGWAAAAGSLQQVIDVATAAQDAAIVRLAAIEPEWLDDGTEVETHKALGHIALDAPSILSGALVTAPLHAERRVRTAAHLAADGPADSATHTGLGGLHAAMGAGRLDTYRAGVVADELEHAPSEVRATVVAALQEHFGREDGTHLRRRCRRVLARISPDLLLQRAARARAESGLRRWADEPGVDKWEGTFPSEEAARAWAAIDALARQYVSDGLCATIERARAKALTDLVAGNATIETVLTVTVPAEALSAPTTAEGSTTTAGAEVPTAIGDGDLVEVTGPTAGQPVLVSRQWLAVTADSASSVEVAPCHPATGALLASDAAPPARTDSTGPAAHFRLPAAADVANAGDDDASATPADGDTTRADRATSAAPTDPVVAVAAAAAGFGAEGYRPSARMAKRIRARDRRCRFPGCTVAAVFCDLDHVRPWPAGRTTDDNLLCLCRRHHRVKQRRGWRVTLEPDGVATWTDPTGRVRTTYPVDALHATVLTAPRARPDRPTPPATTSRPRTVIPDGPHTELEFRLEHLATVATATTRGRRRRSPPVVSWRDDNGIRHVPELTPPTDAIVLDRTTTACRRLRRHGRHTFPDDPPF